MSLSLSVMSALTSGSWLLYGLLIGDLVIIVSVAGTLWYVFITLAAVP